MPPTVSQRELDARITSWAMPIVLCLAGYFAQGSYSQIKAQLDRIEARQQSDNIAIAELKLRVLQLERLTGNNADSAVKPAPTPARAP
jgi:hypothetical protein